MANKNLGNKIKEFRLRLGMTQQQLADKLGLKNKSTLGSWEMGKSEPDFATIAKLCGLLEIDPNTFFGVYGKTDFQYDGQNILKGYKNLDLKSRHYIEGRIDELIKEQSRMKLQPSKHNSQKMYEIPFYDTRASAGTGTGIYGDVPSEKVEYDNVPYGTDHALKITGNSMAPRYVDGQVIFVKEQPQIELGQVGIFIIDDQVFLKKFGGDRLISLNKDYEDIMLADTECRCIGRVLN